MVGNLKLVGLTGGIGSGKSTVGRMINALGVPVIDADQLAREIVAPGEPAHAEILAAWPEVRADDGNHIDRKRLGAIVFADPAARARLEAITHPRIRERGFAQARALAAAGHPLAFYEASLLIEAGRQDDFDGVVLVVADPERQLLRTMARDGATRAQAEARLQAQLPLAEKRRFASHIIDNDGDLAATQQQVEALVARLRGR